MLPKKYNTRKNPLFFRGSKTAKKDKEKSDRDADENNKKSTIDQTQLVIAFFMLIVAAVQAVLFIWQLRLTENAATAAKDSVNVARDTLIASQRPWVTARVSLFDKIGLDENGTTHLKIRFILKNVGHSPALHVSPSASLTSANDFTAAQHIRCGKDFDSNSTRDFIGFTIFPDEEVDITTEIGGPGSADVKEWVKNVQARVYGIPVRLFACIGYRSNLQDDTLWTGYISNMWTIKVGEDNVAPNQEFFWKKSFFGYGITK
jgi:hypothetical protein